MMTMMTKMMVIVGAYVVSGVDKVRILVNQELNEFRLRI